MADDQKKLIVDRGQVKAKVTRFKTYLDSIDASQDISQLKLRLEKFHCCWSDFESVQTKIELAIEDDSTHSQEREQFENQFFELVVRAEALLAANSRSESTTTLETSNLNNSTVNTNNPLNVKLPTIKLPTFNGKYEEWLPFQELFQSLIHNNNSLSDVQKFHYLKTSLQGQASSVIESLEVCATNYSTAWSLLTKRFNNKRMIVNKHIASIMEINKIDRESGPDLRQLLDTTNKHLRALQSLGEQVDSWDTLLIYILTKKLDFNSFRQWENQITTTDVPSFSELENFLENRCRTLEAIDTGKYKTKTSTPSKQPFTKQSYATVLPSAPKCSICNSNHKIFQCETFRKMSSTDRFSSIKKLGLCLNCFSKQHKIIDCTSSNCRKCNKKHNTLLHHDTTEITRKLETNENTSNVPTVTTLASGTKKHHVLLSTAIVKVPDNTGTMHKCRVLLDAGSQSNFITERMAKKLGSPRVHSGTHLVTGIGQSQSKITHSVSCTIFSCYTSYQATLDCLVLKEITNELPSVHINSSNWNVPSSLDLADVTFNIPGPIDMLIGAELFFTLICIGQIKPHKDAPIFQKTLLGWIASGKTVSAQSLQETSAYHVSVESVQEQLKQFWEIEECEPHKNKPITEEEICEAHYVSTTSRDTSGRYTVDLPIKDNISQLGNSKTAATSRFLQLERKLAKNPSLHNKYSEFMDEYERLGHMEVITETSSCNETKQSYYIPHLPVIREESTTTKLRVVFDASAKTSTGLSLNETLMVGPTIQQDIFSIIARFRCHRYVLTADIEKMYRQIWVNDLHTELQKILWRKTDAEPIKTYRLKTVTYGTSSAPFLAVRTLQHLAKEEETNFPVGSSVALRDFYVDDLMTGDNSLENVMTVQSELTDLLKSGGFNIRKWNSNSQEILQLLPQEDTVFTEQDDKKIKGDQEVNKKPVKVLGMIWNSHSDCFRYSILEQDPFKKITKRTVLSEIASLYDPLGLIGPVILKSKLFMQDLWKLDLKWDESLPTALHSEWQIFRQQLHSLKDLQVPRHVMCSESRHTELHGFCDSSQRAYGACIYVRSVTKDGNITVELLCAKSRVSPMNNTTIPRLELCGALLLSRLFTKVVTANVKYDKCVLWSDSTIVLAWINSPSSNWKTFVSNRVKEIQERTKESCEWRHVRTACNPADLISRGLNPCQVINCQLWWKGPQWLGQPPELWPACETIQEKLEPPERRKVNTSLTTIETQPLVDPERYSSLEKVKRVTAFVLRFVNNLKSPEQKTKGPILPQELKGAITYLVKTEQTKHFKEDYYSIKANKALKPSSHLTSLQPFIDDDGLIRVGGRLRHAPINSDQKHPILLPSDSHLTKLLVSQEHKRSMHAGPQLLLSIIRQQYWPLKGRNLVKQVVHKCIKCFRASPKSTQPQMGDLPASRVEMKRPFTNTGTDLAGPIFIRSSQRRNSQMTKGYIVVFVCFATKAIHLELVSGLTTEAYLAALKRFISRRGICTNIYSDNATNFSGAHRELEELRELFMTKEHQRKIIEESAAHQITWHFIPPRSPHFGGLWEASVKSVKHHLKRVIGNASLTYEALYTTLTMIEACLNSRPLTPLSNNPNDTLPLTPGHFLTGDALTAIPEPSLETLPENRLSMWQRAQQLTQHFWSRWSQEYLTSLQQRTKWRAETPNIQPGQLVIVKDDNLPPLRWITARVVEVHPGADNKIRVATIKTSTGTYRRATNKLCVLPLE